MPALATSAQNYLHETLGVSTSSHEPWAGLESLPYFLRDAFDFWQLDILGHKVLLALERNPAKPSIVNRRLIPESSIHTGFHVILSPIASPAKTRETADQMSAMPPVLFESIPRTRPIRQAPISGQRMTNGSIMAQPALSQK